MPEPGHVIGLDIGATDVKALLWPVGAAQPRHRLRRPSQTADGPEACLEAAARAAEAVCQEAGLALDATLGVGVGIFGPVDRDAGILCETPLFPTWPSVPLAAPLSQHLGVPVHAENDANLAVYGEWWQGAGQRAAVLVGLTLGTGIGGGIVAGGDIFRGARGYAGELGHISVSPEGPPCPCGNTGCLGRRASATALVRRYRERVGDVPEGLTARDIAEAARQGDPDSAAIIGEVAEDLARAILVLADCFNPDCVVLCGGLSQMGPLLLDPIRAWLVGKSFRAVVESLNLVTGAFTVWSGAVGAAGWALRQHEASTGGGRP